MANRQKNGHIGHAILMTALLGAAVPHPASAQFFDPQPMTGDGSSGEFLPKKPVFTKSDTGSQPPQPEFAYDAKPSSGDPATTQSVKSDEPSSDALSDDASKPSAKGRMIGSGRASWYKHNGKTASGERFNPNGLTAAHHSLPFGSRIKVVNKKNGKSVVVTVNDRTNENTKKKRGYVIDLSRASAEKLGIKGVSQVALYTDD